MNNFKISEHVSGSSCTHVLNNSEQEYIIWLQRYAHAHRP